MTASEGRGIRDLATFSAVIHLMGQLRYPRKAISDATSKKLGRHLWYLSEELVGLALFDSRLHHNSKKLMLTAMEEVGPDHPTKQPHCKAICISWQQRPSAVPHEQLQESVPNAGTPRNNTSKRTN